MFERKVSRIAAFAAGPGAVNVFCKRDTGASSFPGVLPGKEAAMAAPIKPQIATTVRTFSAFDRFTLRVGRTGGVRNLRSRGSSVASSLQVGCRGKRHTCERLVVERCALEVRGVCKRYNEREALSSVDLAVPSGHVHGLLGPNGAGKTTLLRVLLGLVRPDAGSVQLLGSPLNSIAGPIPDNVAGFVETPNFYPYLSGRQNLALLARLDGRDGRGNRIVGNAVEQVGLTPHADVPVANYSAGMRQRLGLAAVLLRSPRLLLLDEPTSSLDPPGAADVRSIIRRLGDDGVTIVLSSHDMSEVEELCASLTFLRGGRVVFSGSID